MEPSPEFDLLIACCRWPPSPLGDARVTAAAEAASLDWDSALAAAARHRVEGFVHTALRRTGVEPPARVAECLAQQASGIVHKNLSFAAAALKLSERLSEAGIEHLFVKGVTLNLLAYGTLALKRSCDIDVLVPPEDYEAAFDLLEDTGYRCFHPPGADKAGILRYAASYKDSAWRSGDGRTKLELHQRLCVNPALLPGVGARSPSVAVEVAPGVILRTLARDELFAYLCTHGALTAWSRLKWLADLAALIADEDEAGVERLYRRSVQLAPRRAVAQALLLANRLFDTPLSGPLVAELRGDRVNRFLEREALQVMAGGGARELDEQKLASARLNLTVLMLEPGWRYKAAEIGRKLPRIPAALRSAIGGARAR